MILIDSDTACFAAAFTTEDQPEQEARYNINRMMEDLLIDLNTQDYMMFLTGTGNFRYKVYYEYKANRKEQKRPRHLEMLKQHLIDSWGAILSNGCEADDLVAMEHHKRDYESIVVSTDKDLLQLYGRHYNPKKKLFQTVSPLEGLRFFYTQCLEGDTADNVKGVKGIGKVKAARYLADATTEEEMFNIVRGLYDCDEEFAMNARVLWLWRTENEDVTERWVDFGWENN